MCIVARHMPRKSRAVCPMLLSIKRLGRRFVTSPDLTAAVPGPRLQSHTVICTIDDRYFPHPRGIFPGLENCIMAAEQKPPQPTPKRGTVSLELGEKEAEGIYANLCVISHSSSEVILDFARALPGAAKSRVHARIIMTPQHAKSLHQALGVNLKKFEEQHGTIRVPRGDGGSDADRKSIGF